MRKILALSGVVLTSLMFTGSAFAQGAAPPAPPAGGAPAADSGDDDKKIGVGGDLQFVLPLGDFADGSGPLIGPVLRVGYRVMPPLELNLKAGFLYGLTKSQGPLDIGVNIIPISVGGRYFIMDPHAGLYGGLDIAINLISPKASFNGVDASGDSSTRIGANIGVGYVISKELPIDIRGQLMLLNVGDSGGLSLGIGISGGYTYQF